MDDQERHLAVMRTVIAALRLVGDAGAAQCPIERALDLAEPDCMLFPSLIHPAPGPDPRPALPADSLVRSGDRG